MLGFAIDNWQDVNGFCVAHRIDFRHLNVSDGADLIWWMLTKDGDEQGKERLKVWLWRPPKGVVPTKGPWTAEAETAALRNLQAGLASG